MIFWKELSEVEVRTTGVVVLWVCFPMGRTVSLDSHLDGHRSLPEGKGHGFGIPQDGSTGI